MTCAYRRIPTTLSVWLVLMCCPGSAWTTAGDQPGEAAAAGNLPVLLQLRDKATVDGHLVRLGQLVLLPADHPSTDRLQQLVLGPAPTVGETQHWGRERIGRMLERHGWSEHRYRWSGAKSCQLHYTPPVAPAAPYNAAPHRTPAAGSPSSSPSPSVQTASASGTSSSAASVQTADFQRRSTSPADVMSAGATSANGVEASLTPAELAIRKRQREMAERHLRQALLGHVEAQTGGPGRWNVDFQLPDAYAQLLADRRNLLDISGGSPPWMGTQRLRLLLDEVGHSRALDLECQLTPRPWVVTAAGPLRRDRNLEVSDLEMRPLEQEVEDVESFFFTDVQQALGLRVTQAVTSGQPLRRSYTAPPMVVDRHSGVEVLVRSGLIEITTQGRCLDAGGLGDVIAVEILPQKHRLMARVIDSHRVEVVTGEAGGGALGRTATGRASRPR